MGITFQIPSTARPISTNNIFSGVFNNPTIGKYDFNILANKNQVVTPLQEKTIYLIERISVGGNISESTFLDAVELDQATNSKPEYDLRYSINKTKVYQKSFPVLNYIDDKDVVMWVLSDKGHNELTMDFNALLNQTAELVGVSEIKISINLTMYAIDDIGFNSRFRDILSGNVGQQVMGGL